MSEATHYCHICGDEITDWGDDDWHHVPRTDPDDYIKGHDHDAMVKS